MRPAPPADTRRSQPFLKQVIADSEYVALIDASGRKLAVDFARTNRSHVDIAWKNVVSAGFVRNPPDRCRIRVSGDPPSDTICGSDGIDRRRLTDNHQVNEIGNIAFDTECSRVPGKREPFSDRIRN